MISEIIYNITLRNKEYEVHVRNSSTPITTFWFIYNKTKLEYQVYLPDEISDNDIRRVLTQSVKRQIQIYNKKKKARRT